MRYQILLSVLPVLLGNNRFKCFSTQPNFKTKHISSFICCLKELVVDGLRFPVVGLNSPSTVSNVLLQQPGKLKAKQLREGEQLHEFRMNPTGDSSGLNLLAK